MLVAAVGGVELTVKPFDREFYKPLGDAIVFTCQLELSAGESEDVAYTIQWFDLERDRQITDRTGRSGFVFFPAHIVSTASERC